MRATDSRCEICGEHKQWVRRSGLYDHDGSARLLCENCGGGIVGKLKVWFGVVDAVDASDESLDAEPSDADSSEDDDENEDDVEDDDRAYNECPECGSTGADWFVLGWHLCTECELIFTESGEVMSRDV